MDILEKLSLAGLVPVIKIDDPEDAVPLCKALADGGLPVAEITFRTAAAEESIRRVHEELPNVILCAGTVLTTDQVDRAVNAGAAAIVSPGLNPEVVKYCLSKNIPVCPGTANPSDIEVALSLGLKAVKVFPAEAIGGIKLIKSMAAPYVGMKFMPTGGINEKMWFCLLLRTLTQVFVFSPLTKFSAAADPGWCLATQSRTRTGTGLPS